MKNPYLFDLAKSKPIVDKKKSGTVRGAYEKNFPIVKQQAGAMFLVILDKGGIREPHWHPNAWEFDYCISGKARMSVVTPDNEWKIFDVEPGQAVFVPQGYFHYFETEMPMSSSTSASRSRSAACRATCWRRRSA